MTGFTLTIDAETQPFEDVMARLLQAAGDLGPALKNIGEHETASTKSRIKRGITPEGAPFAPLNPLYAMTKKGPGILQGESGRLADIVYQLAGDTVEVGNDVPHGAMHQFGGTIHAKNVAALMFSMGGQHFMVESVTIPARPYIGISTEDEAEIYAILEDHFLFATTGSFEPE